MVQATSTRDSILRNATESVGDARTHLESRRELTDASLARGDAWVAALTVLPSISPARLAYVWMVKRWLDLLVAGSLLLVLALPLLFVLVLIRIDSRGPAIFRQRRIGRGGQTFTLYKFRTMTHNPLNTLTWFIDDDGTARHKVRDDPRVTRVGRWLRRTSIDELPQLLNVLRGDMSLIGPRPELPEIVATYQPWQHDRHLVRPGITGWWQVSGRGDRPMHENTALDIFYVTEQSFRLDMRIAWRTVRVVLKGLGAF